MSESSHVLREHAARALEIAGQITDEPGLVDKMTALAADYLERALALEQQQKPQPNSAL